MNETLQIPIWAVALQIFAVGVWVGKLLFSAKPKPEYRGHVPPFPFPAARSTPEETMN